MAPAGPMAMVATGTPPGIWTMESSESRPDSALLWTGTPMTGTVVREATIPGRWAAPPAPAMMTWRLRASASRAYLTIQPGVRCADTTRHSCATPNWTRTSAAAFIVSQSDRLPMITPTVGVPAAGGEAIGAPVYGSRHPAPDGKGQQRR